MIIYVIKIKGEEKYIGLTRCALEKRWREHRCAAKYSDLPLYRAMRKYGIENCSIEHIASAVSADVLGQLEIDLIADRGTHISVSGYNVSTGGENGWSGSQRPQGERCYRAKLTDDFVRYIRDLELVDVTNGELVEIAATQFGIHASRDCIRDARRGDSWRDLDTPPIKRGQGRFNPKVLEKRRAHGRMIFNRPDVRAKNDAVKKAAFTGKPLVKNCKLTSDQVRHAFVSKDSAQALANAYGVSKKTILNIRHKKILQYNEYLGN